MSSEMRIERCIECDEPTGRAGKYDDSLYCDECGEGPFCEEHAAEHRCDEDAEDDKQ